MLRFIRPLFIVLCLSLLCITTIAQAQQKVFNVSSPDIMDPGRLSFSQIHNFRPWRTSSGSAALLDLQGVYGVGGNMEMGFNMGSFNYKHLADSTPFMDATLKWRPWHITIDTGNTKNSFGLIIGDNLGIGTNGHVGGHVRNLAYLAPYIDFGVISTRISAGVYHATRDVFDGHDRTGVQVTFEHSIPLTPLILAADWYSGNGGSLTPGLLWNNDPMSIGIGYSLSNNGRKNDLIILSTTFKF